MTPITPRPCSLDATITSRGFAVAQKIRQISWHCLIAFRTFMGKPSFRKMTDTWPHERVRRIDRLFWRPGRCPRGHQATALASEKATPSFSVRPRIRHLPEGRLPHKRPERNQAVPGDMPYLLRYGEPPRSDSGVERAGQRRDGGHRRLSAQGRGGRVGEGVADRSFEEVRL